MRFSRWLDSQSAPRPGEPDRRCDTIMELVHREGLSHTRAVVIMYFWTALLAFTGVAVSLAGAGTVLGVAGGIAVVGLVALNLPRLRERRL